MNGRESSPEMCDLSRLMPLASGPTARLCRTPEAFLGPTGASLVNLDALIPSNPPAKMHKNPFLSGTTKLLVHYRHCFVIITFLPQVSALRLPPTLSTATTLALPSTK